MAEQAERAEKAGHRRRLRDRFRRAGLEGLAEHEILELLLTFAVPRRDCKPIARALLKRFGNLPAALAAPPAMLAQVAGVGEQSTTLMALVWALGAWCLRHRVRGRSFVRDPGAVVDYLRAAIGRRPEEVFWVLLLNSRNEIIGDQMVQQGTVDQAAVFPRQVLEPALKYKAAALVLVHNHPGGGLNPSALDRRVTRELVQAARALQLKVHDHLIITGEGYFSFAEHGLMA